MTRGGLRYIATTASGVITHDNAFTGAMGDLHVVAIQSTAVGEEVTSAGGLPGCKGVDDILITQH